VAQLTLQNLLVLGVGNWPTEDEQLAPDPQPTPTGRTQGQEETGPKLPDVMTLALSQQDALVLKWAREAGASLTVVMRRNGDEGQVETTAVTLQYLMERFRIEAPPKLPLGLDDGRPVATPQEPEN
jgi:Flp pilus assembly protein CpaB